MIKILFVCHGNILATLRKSWFYKEFWVWEAIFTQCLHGLKKS